MNTDQRGMKTEFWGLLILSNIYLVNNEFWAGLVFLSMAIIAFVVGTIGAKEKEA